MEDKVTVEEITKFLFELDPMGFNTHGDMPEDHFDSQAKMAYDSIQQGLSLPLALTLAFDHYFNYVINMSSGEVRRTERPHNFETIFTEACEAWKDSYDNS